MSALPVKKYYQICVGMAGMQPTEFWNCSLIEVYNAIDGFGEFNGATQEAPMDKNELSDLMEMFPD